MAARRMITLNQLSAWITSQVQKHEDCEDATVNVLYKLQEPDAEGCNWSDQVVMNPGTSTATAIRPVLMPIIIEARKLFNVHG